MTCSCALSPGSSYYHCRGCCSTYSSLSLWDAHRDSGGCFNLEGVYEEAGVTVVSTTGSGVASYSVLSTEEGHAKRRALSERFKKNREH